MIVVDANLLIYAVNEDAPLHREAKAWLESLLSGNEEVGLAWSVILAFLRLTTRTGIFQKPLNVNSAFDVIESWVVQQNVSVIEPGSRHLIVLRDLLKLIGMGGTWTSDAHLAALAIEHGAEALLHR